MLHNQVWLFQINDYANHYVNIEITGYRALYSKTIAGRGVARLIVGWAQQGQLTALINQCLTVILEYIDLLFFIGRVTANFWLGLLLATPLKRRHSTRSRSLLGMITLVNWNAVNNTVGGESYAWEKFREFSHSRETFLPVQVVYIFRTGPRTEGIKFGPPDRTRYLNLMRMFYGLKV